MYDPESPKVTLYKYNHITNINGISVSNSVNYTRKTDLEGIGGT